jgi:hypothetical protein
MRTLLLIFIAICIVITALDIATFVKTGTDQKPNEAYTALTSLPPHAVSDPKTNGYFLLLGFASSPGIDAVQTGFDMWVEAQADRGHLFFDYGKPGRVRIRIGGDTLDALQALTMPDPATHLHQVANSLTSSATDYAPLTDRYLQWLNMPFEDWGYGHLGSPRFSELYLAHRLYVAGGFAQGSARGAERLARDLYTWRSVLARAKTLPMKMMAVGVVDDDVQIASKLLAQRDLDQVVLGRLTQLARPLTRAERSLRWPVQNEFLTAVSRYEGSWSRMSVETREESDNNKKWLATMIGLQSDAFQKVEHPLSANALAHGQFQKQRANNTYARYYEATIMAAELPHGRLPKLTDFVGGPARAFFDYLINPVDNIFESGFEPDWQPFLERLMETDARLRLVGLQVKLRGGAETSTVPAQVAEAGDDFHDPFSNFPMLWNPVTKTLYSVGKDGKDDDGDPKRDITVATQYRRGSADKPSGQAARL